MSFNSGQFNNTEFNGAPNLNKQAEGSLSLGLQFKLLGRDGQLTIPVQFKIVESGSLSFAAQLSVINPTGSLTIPALFKIVQTGNISVGVVLSVITPVISAGRVVNAVVTLNNVDVSARIRGLINVKAAEGAARLATFSLVRETGLVDPYEWIGQKVTINFIENSVSKRIFTGLVHVPDFDQANAIVQFKCTDAAQETVELLTEQQIADVVGGHWDANIFPDFKDGWSYTQNRMSTQPASYDLDVYRMPRITPWQPKAVADFSFNASNIVNQSENLQLAERRNIVNSIKLNLSVRFNKKWQKQSHGKWTINDTFETWLLRPYDLPTSDLIEQSLNSQVLQTISFGRLPAESGIYHPTNTIDINVWVATEFTKTLATSAFFMVSKRWLQTVTKQHEVFIKSDASIGQHGLLQIEKNVTVTIENGQDWESYEAYSNPTGSSVGQGATVDVSDVSYNNAVNTVLNEQKTSLLKTHRQNKFTFQTPLNPYIDLNHTASAVLQRLDVQGKVSEVEHNINLETGRCTSKITLSLYLPDIAGQTDQALSINQAIELVPSLDNNTIDLDTHVGNERTEVDPFFITQDEAWLGWVTNYEDEIFLGEPVNRNPDFVKYDEKWTVEIPNVIDSDRDAITQSQTDSINVAIPQNNLIITI